MMNTGGRARTPPGTQPPPGTLFPPGAYWCLCPAILSLPRHREAHCHKGFPQFLNVEIWLKMWGSITLLNFQLFQCVLLPLSFCLQVSVVGQGSGRWGK